MKLKYLGIGVIGISLLAASCGNSQTVQNQPNTNDETNTQQKEEGVAVGGALMVKSKNIVENAANASNVTTLVAAVKAAGLAGTLSGPGPFTVFGPTNEAFAKLPTGTVEMLLKPENKQKLVDILTYHVVPGALKISDLQDGQMLTTVEGKQLKISKQGGSVTVNGAQIETPDVISSNGVTHVIGSVLLPPDGVMVGGALMVKNLNIVQNAANADNVSTLVVAVKAAGLDKVLSGAGPFTVFAPNNEAFNKLPEGTVTNLLKPENKASLTKILTYHVVAGKYLAADLKDGMVLKTVEGEALKIGNKNGVITVNGSAIVQTKDVVSSNGVTFVIDGVLMPGTMMKK